MAMSIRNDKVERLVEELAGMTGESKTAAIVRALKERRERIVLGRSGKRLLAQALDFLEREIWPNIPRKLPGRPVTRRERERILGYGTGGV
jgi:antitoxin VapB